MANNNKLKEVLSSTQNDLGRIYKFTTLLLGMTPDEHEFKVMGLAAYTKKKYYMHIYTKLKQITEVRKCLFQEKQRDKDLEPAEVNFERERFDNIAELFNFLLKIKYANLFLISENLILIALYLVEVLQ